MSETTLAVTQKMKVGKSWTAQLSLKFFQDILQLLQGTAESLEVPRWKGHFFPGNTQQISGRNYGFLKMINSS